MKKSVKLACHVVKLNIGAFGALPTLQISLRIVALFEKIIMMSRSLPLLGNNYCFQMT
jgi:hypothetical protein